jgi:hypothetical protein
MGEAGLLGEDKYLAEVNLDDPTSTTGNQQEYGFLQSGQQGRQAYFIFISPGRELNN